MTRDRTEVSATFFAPYDRAHEPYIRVATGDYLELKREGGRDDALAAILCSVAHEIVHYEQWHKGSKFCEQAANLRARQIVRKYSKTTKHP